MIHSPELLLPELNRALRELRGAASLLNDESLDAELLPVMRRLLLAEVIGNSWIVAIAGLQGAGKTTLLRTMYGLTDEDAEWLTTNEGRGEKLPILIVEQSGRSHAQGAVRALQSTSPGQFALIEKEVSQAEFQQAFTGGDPQVLLPVLKVPPRYFRRLGQAWLLLPGYEGVSRDNKAWQELMRQAVVGVAGCVIVTDETRLARQDQVLIVEDMLSNELRDAHPIVVVSKTEGLADNPEGLAKLQQTAAQVFRFDDDAMRRQVICTGSASPEYVTHWLPKLTTALRDLSGSGAVVRQHQLARLEDVLNRDLGRAHNKINLRAQLFFQQQTGGVAGPQHVLKTCLEAFDEARETLRSNYCESVENLLSGRTGKAWNELQNSLVANHEGVKNKFVNWPDTVSETQLRIEKDVDAAWSKPGSVLEQFSSVLGEVTGKVLGSMSPQMLSGARALTQEPLTHVGDEAVEQNAATKGPNIDEGILHNLRVIFRPTTPNDPADPNESTVTSVDFERAIAVLPALGLEYARVAALLPRCVGVDPTSLAEMPQADMALSTGRVVQGFEQAKILSNTLVKALAMVFVADVAVDGKADILQAVTGGAAASAGSAATTAGGAAAAATAATVMQAVAGLVAVGYLVHLALREVRNHDKEVRAHAYRMLANISDRHFAHFTSHFDTLMNQLRMHLKRQFSRRYGLDAHLMEQDRLAKALADVRTAQRELLDELGRSGQTLEIFESATA